jgi:hypothetical protein
MEAVGHKEAFDFVSELVKDKVPMSESIIKQIHYLVPLRTSLITSEEPNRTKNSIGLTVNSIALC